PHPEELGFPAPTRWPARRPREAVAALPSRPLPEGVVPAPRRLSRRSLDSMQVLETKYAIEEGFSHLLPTPVLTGSGSTGSPALPASQAPRGPPQGLLRAHVSTPDAR